MECVVNGWSARPGFEKPRGKKRGGVKKSGEKVGRAAELVGVGAGVGYVGNMNFDGAGDEYEYSFEGDLDGVDRGDWSMLE